MSTLSSWVRHLEDNLEGDFEDDFEDELTSPLLLKLTRLGMSLPWPHWYTSVTARRPEPRSAPRVTTTVLRADAETFATKTANIL